MWECSRTQERRLVSSVMCAHCICAGISVDYNPEVRCIAPMGERWIWALYDWQDGYVDKLKKDLISLGKWD